MIPDLPLTVRKAGSVVVLPQTDIKTEADNTTLISRLRSSEVTNARAVNSCKAYHHKLQLLNKAVD